MAPDNYAVLQFMLKHWPPNGLPPALVHAGLQRCTHSCLCVGSVDLLRCAFGLGAERVRVGDLVPVTVSGDDQGAASPLVPLPTAGGYRTECCNPWLVGVEGGVEDGFCSGFDEAAALGQGLLHVGVHGASGFGDQACDEPRALPVPTRAGGAGGGVSDSVVDDRRDVVGVSEPARPDEAWQQGSHVVVVRFGPPQLGREGAEGVGVDDRFCLVGGESAGCDESSPAVVLGCGGDGFVFGGELGDRAPPVLLGGDGLVRRQLSTRMLQDAVEDRAGGGVGVVARMRGGVIIGPVEDHVGLIRFPSAGHGDIQVLPGGGGFDEDVGGVGGDALGAVGGDGVAEVDVLGYVVGG